MKVFISADMEGATGVVAWVQTEPKYPAYEAARALMVGDVNAAIAGAFEGGATEVIVNDSHDVMLNLPLAQIDPRARLLSGPEKHLSMVEGVQGCDLALFTGYHARMGTPKAVLDHTYVSRCHRVWLNDLEVGETGINAAVAGHFGVPVGLVTGDEAVCAEARELLGEVQTAAVKEARGRQSALCAPQSATREIIREAARRAVAGAGRFRPFRVQGVPQGEAAFTVEFADSQQAARAGLYRAARALDGLRVRVQGDDVLAAFLHFLNIIDLSRDPNS